MKTKNIISGLVCSLFVFSGQQSYANTIHSNQSNSTASGLNYVKTDVVKLAKQTVKEVKEETKKDEVKEVKEETKKDEVKELKEEAKKDEVKEVKEEAKKDEVKEVKEETKKDEVKEVKEETKKDEVKEVKEETKKDEVKEVKDVVKNDEKDKDDDGTNPLSFENLVSHDQSDNDHCKSKKGNKCNEGDDEDEDGHHNGDDEDDEHEISPVPIPGAIWLFGTALMGFISMSSRRKV